MAKSSSSASSKTSKAAKSKAGSASVRDIKAKKSSRSVAFDVKELDNDDILLDDVPSVEPLRDDDDFFDEDTDSFGEENVDITYEPRFPSMKVSSVNEEPKSESEEKVASQGGAVPTESADPKDVIKVSFGSFVQLVANHDLADVIEANADQEVIISSNLLTDLASSRDQREEKKIPLVFVVGIAIGVVLTYIFFST